MNRDEEYEKIMIELEGKERIDELQCTRLFNAHNRHFPDVPEYNKSCPACRERVWRRMTAHWQEYKAKNGIA